MHANQERNKISAVIHTFNSEIFLKECLSHLQWCDEIVVVDMFSTDQTRTIAQAAKANIYLHENVGYADPARQFGLSKCSHDWILAIDSDEIVPEILAQKIQTFLKSPNADVVHLCFRNYFFGRELKGSGWSYRDLHVPRLFKKTSLNYGSAVHDFIQISGTARLDQWIERDLAVIHFNYLSVEHFISKLNRYTNFEARKLTAGKNPFYQMSYHFMREFFGRLIILRGYQDGWVGIYLSLAMAFYRWTAIAKANLPDEKNAIELYKEISKNSGKS